MKNNLHYVLEISLVHYLYHTRANTAQWTSDIFQYQCVMYRWHYGNGESYCFNQNTLPCVEDLPFLPQGLVTISITPDSATIQWEAGDNQYLVSVVEYTVEYGETDRLEAGTTAAVVLGPDSDVGSADLRGLLPATRYYYSVVASTAVGEKRSPLKTFQTKEDVTGMEESPVNLLMR